MSNSTFNTATPLPDDIQQELIMSANNGLTKSTWSGYRGVWKHVLECSTSTGMSTSLPFSPDQVYNLIGYWMARKHLKAKTISSYLSGLRMIHIINGFPEVMLRTPTVELILSGRANLDEIKSREKPSRLPITLKKLEAINL